MAKNVYSNDVFILLALYLFISRI